MDASRRQSLTLIASVAAWSAFGGLARAGETEVRVFEIAILGGKVADANTTIRVTEGDRVELRYTSDRSVELHLHGYDVEIAVEPGETGIMSFNAFATGRFPIAAHGAGGGHAPLLYFEVYPD